MRRDDRRLADHARGAHTAGALVKSIQVPNSTQAGVTSSSDQMVTSFSSKSELAVNLSTDGK
jgi:hypothetical protein